MVQRWDVICVQCSTPILMDRWRLLLPFCFLFPDTHNYTIKQFKCLQPQEVSSQASQYYKDRKCLTYSKSHFLNCICIQRHMTKIVLHEYKVESLHTLVESSETNSFSKKKESWIKKGMNYKAFPVVSKLCQIKLHQTKMWVSCCQWVKPKQPKI